MIIFRPEMIIGNNGYICHNKTRNLETTLRIDTMKQLLVTAAATALLATTSFTVQAGPAAFVDISYHFGGKAGITAKVLSSDKADKAVAALGATYYFNAKAPLGVDLSLGYAFENAAALVGYDFLQKQPAISAGWADVDDNDSARDVVMDTDEL